MKTSRLRWHHLSIVPLVVLLLSPGWGWTRVLENPQPGSFQSGIGVISGWVCNATRVEIRIDDGAPFPAAYGTSRADTADPKFCGDDGNNGFGLLFNWNILGDGVHRVRALADGVVFADVTFVVTTLGQGEFARGLTGATQIANFPQAGTVMRLQWQESQQNFSLSGAVPAGVSAAQCATQAATATDANGATASLSWSNPCLLSAGQAMLLTINNALSGATTAGLRAQTAPRPFFACDTDLRFVQGGRVFDASQFEWIDLFGERVCRMIAPGRSLQTFIRPRPRAQLNFNGPFQAEYAGRPVIDFPAREPCQLGVSPLVLDFGSVPVGEGRDTAVQVRNNGSGVLQGQATITAGGRHFQLLSPGSFALLEGQSQQIGVSFRPAAAGNHEGNIEISSNCGSALVRLSGQGVLPQPPQLSASPEKLDFGTIPRGGSSTREVVVTNVGGGTLEGELVLILEQGTSGSPIRFSLGPGQSRTISVTVTVGPNGPGGPFRGTVKISSNGGFKEIPVSGIVR
ncbi:MAG: choice-of-anchor D domain-containing protein [Candidatus Binatia bacterium]|nr:choice-of-anchor D domain-containing protein [Candidatus Binatia bacterium]